MFFKTTLILTILGFVAPLVAEGADAIIRVPEVEVRSKPGYKPECYPTGKLYQGDLVRRKPEMDAVGFLAIEPPLGTFSLIPKSAVTSNDGQHGVVNKEPTETTIGSPFTDRCNVRGAILHRGHQVSILGTADKDGQAYYKIEPAGEVHYIPAEALGRSSEIVLTAGAAVKASPGISGEYATKVQEADAAYRVAESTGDWAAPKRLYENIARGDNHEARMIAWNRLEFIRRRMQGYHPPAPAAQVTSNYGGYSPMRKNSSTSYSQNYYYSQPAAPSYYAAPASQSYQPPRNTGRTTYTTDNYKRNWTNPAPAPSARAKSSPAYNQSRYTPTPTASSTVANLGWLERSYHSLADGRPLYMLKDSMGQLRCYVEPMNGLNLDQYLNRVVELQGGPMMYHPTLRQNYLQAMQVIPR